MIIIILCVVFCYLLTMSESGNGGEPPKDFNECVSKDELRRLFDDQCIYIDGEFDELMRNTNGLVTRN